MSLQKLANIRRLSRWSQKKPVLWLAAILREVGAPALLRQANWAWCIGIVYSTLAIRQHVFIDVAAGAALGGGLGALSLWYRQHRMVRSA